MSRRRGFFAEIQYQSVQAEKRRQREQAAAARSHASAVRANDRALVSAVRQKAATDKGASAAAARKAVEAGIAEAAAMTDDVNERYAEIDSLLAATLDVDDYIDVAGLRIDEVEHPLFDASGLDKPHPPVQPFTAPPEPTWTDVPEPTGMAAKFGGKKRHEEKVAAQRAAFEQAHAQWRQYCESGRAQQAQHEAEHATKEQERTEKLAAAQAVYEKACGKREADAAEHNTRLDKFVNDLAFDVEEAIDEYIGMVLENSQYPDEFPVEHDHSFDLASRELTVTVVIPEPSTLPSVKEFKNVKAKDEITETALSAKAQKERYANAVHQVALRTLHEVFEADRLGKVQSASVTVAVRTTAAHSGLIDEIPIARVAADREPFLQFDLANVVPSATLAHLGASLSKSPFDLTPAAVGADVRTRKA